MKTKIEMEDGYVQLSKDTKIWDGDEKLIIDDNGDLGWRPATNDELESKTRPVGTFRRKVGEIRTSIFDLGNFVVLNEQRDITHEGLVIRSPRVLANWLWKRGGVNCALVDSRWAIFRRIDHGSVVDADCGDESKLRMLIDLVSK